MALSGFAEGADFEIRVTGWLGTPPSEKALGHIRRSPKCSPGLVQW
jgi:type IV secretory pathway VirJ component